MGDMPGEESVEERRDAMPEKSTGQRGMAPCGGAERMWPRVLPIWTALWGPSSQDRT